MVVCFRQQLRVFALLLGLEALDTLIIGKAAGASITRRCRDHYLRKLVRRRLAVRSRHKLIEVDGRELGLVGQLARSPVNSLESLAQRRPLHRLHFTVDRKAVVLINVYFVALR